MTYTWESIGKYVIYVEIIFFGNIIITAARA